MTSPGLLGKSLRWQSYGVSCMLERVMRLSRQVQYALCGIFDLAYNGAGGPVRVQTIGERQRIPHRFLEQIFQRLRRAGLVAGKRGPGGGYVLTRSPENISLREVIEAIEGPFGEVDSENVDPWPDSAHRPDFLWSDLSGRMAEMLSGIAISDVCREAVRRSVVRELPDGLDYQI
jgi:Rrf2 family iron-sulfur cluster assembly transcriptional regulator